MLRSAAQPVRSPLQMHACACTEEHKPDTFSAEKSTMAYLLMPSGGHVEQQVPIITHHGLLSSGCCAGRSQRCSWSVLCQRFDWIDRAHHLQRSPAVPPAALCAFAHLQRRTDLISRSSHAAALLHGHNRKRR